MTILEPDRIIQLTYNIQNQVGSGCWEDEDRGISRFYGRNLIREMNQVGMLIDLSHCGEKTCFDAVELSERPVAITHANPSGWAGFDIELNRRNKSDDLIRAVADGGGVIGLGMYPKIMRGGSAWLSLASRWVSRWRCSCRESAMRALSDVEIGDWSSCFTNC